MGLPNLRDKIKRKLQKEDYSEEDVLYLLVEIRKYLERSSKDLRDSTELKIKEGGYPTIKLFRDWACHPKKHSSDISKETLLLLEKAASGDEKSECKLLKQLSGEIIKFHEQIKSDDVDCKINWEIFFKSLKNILSEQPLEIKANTKSICYNDSLRLIEIKTPETGIRDL